MKKKVIDMLVCPICKKGLLYVEKHKELICWHHKIAYPIKDEIPVMIYEEARNI